MPIKKKLSAENQSVARALVILKLLAESQEPLGVREIARQLRVSPSIAQRLIATLARAGFLEQVDETLRYMIGYRAFQIGNAFVSQATLHSAVMPELYALADQHINAFLGVHRERSVVYLATVQSSGPVAINHQPGARTYLHSTALGKVLLAAMSDDEARALLAHGSMPRVTPQTKTAIPQILSELSDVRRLGYAVSDSENRAGFFSVGAAIRDSSGMTIAAISGSVPGIALTARERTRIVDLVTDAAERASKKLGAAARKSISKLKIHAPKRKHL